MTNTNSIRQMAWFLCISVGITSAAHAAIYNESISGDLSDNGLAPTAFGLTAGANSIIGSVGSTNTQDFVVVTVPAGFKLDSFVNVAYGSSDPQGFTGFDTGPTFAGSPFSAGSYDGYAHFGTGATNPGVNGGAPASTIGVDLLPVPYMADNSPSGTAAGAAGFSIPLSAGTYTFLIQQLGATTSYEFSFGVSAVPEPSGIILSCLASFVGLLGIRHLHRR